jgi:hypothetical protein
MAGSRCLVRLLYFQCIDNFNMPAQHALSFGFNTGLLLLLLPCRLEGLDLQTLGFTTLLVDPPRAGLDSQTVQLMRDFERVVYVSCNPGVSARGGAWMSGSAACSLHMDCCVPAQPPSGVTLCGLALSCELTPMAWLPCT